MLDRIKCAITTGWKVWKNYPEIKRIAIENKLREATRKRDEAARLTSIVKKLPNEVHRDDVLGFLHQTNTMAKGSRPSEAACKAFVETVNVLEGFDDQLFLMTWACRKCPSLVSEPNIRQWATDNSAKCAAHVK